MGIIDWVKKTEAKPRSFTKSIFPVLTNSEAYIIFIVAAHWRKFGCSV